MNRIRSLVLLSLGAMLLSSCTLIPTAHDPIIIKRGPGQFGLLGKTIPGTNSRVQFITQRVYIVDATGHLTPSSRIVPSPPTLDSVLGELILGPTDIETSAGFTSALPKRLVILQATVKNGIGFVALTSPLSDLPHAREVLAIGQLVLTARDVGATNGLEVLVAGVAQSLLKPSGKKSRHVYARDYQSLLNA